MENGVFVVYYVKVIIWVYVFGGICYFELYLLF